MDLPSKAKVEGPIASEPNPMDPEDEEQWVTKKKRARIMAERREEDRAQKADQEALHQNAWADSLGNTRAHYATQECNPADGIAIKVHPTHHCIQCGGYVGCLTCWSIGSTHKHGQRLEM